MQPHSLPQELELELIQPHMAQKPVLRGKVGCACVAREVSVERRYGRARVCKALGWVGVGVKPIRPQGYLISTHAICLIYLSPSPMQHPEDLRIYTPQEAEDANAPVLVREPDAASSQARSGSLLRGRVPSSTRVVSARRVAIEPLLVEPSARGERRERNHGTRLDRFNGFLTIADERRRR